VDKVYKADIPEKRKALEKLRAEFSKLPTTTDWAKLRVDPLLQHVKQLEQRLRSQGSARLSKGVKMFHSDLVYLRENVNGLKEILRSEKRSLQRRLTKPRRRGR
jgi:predicted  nucleic acid-binding Zn-ribbon protein